MCAEDNSLVRGNRAYMRKPTQTLDNAELPLKFISAGPSEAGAVRKCGPCEVEEGRRGNEGNALRCDNAL